MEEAGDDPDARPRSVDQIIGIILSHTHSYTPPRIQVHHSEIATSVMVSILVAMSLSIAGEKVNSVCWFAIYHVTHPHAGA